MTVIRTYLCPGTPEHDEHQFRYLHHPSAEEDPLPRYCGVCGFDSAGEAPVAALTSPHLALSIRKTVDTMHRQMEDGAEFRANIMQENHGMDYSEARVGLETNMRDNAREGDTTFQPVQNEVTQIMAQAPGTTGFNNAAGASFSEATGTGPSAGRHGDAARRALRERHATYTANAGHAGTTSSNLPVVTR